MNIFLDTFVILVERVKTLQLCSEFLLNLVVRHQGFSRKDSVQLIYLELVRIACSFSRSVEHLLMACN